MASASAGASRALLAALEGNWLTTDGTGTHLRRKDRSTARRACSRAALQRASASACSGSDRALTPQTAQVEQPEPAPTSREGQVVARVRPRARLDVRPLLFPVAFRWLTRTTNHRTGALSEENCHPWRYHNLLWMHNGCIADFRLIVRKLQADLSDEFYHLPQGNTDSEWAFACYLECLSKVRHRIPHPPPAADPLARSSPTQRGATSRTRSSRKRCSPRSRSSTATPPR